MTKHRVRFDNPQENIDHEDKFDILQRKYNNLLERNWNEQEYSKKIEEENNDLKKENTYYEYKFDTLQSKYNNLLDRNWDDRAYCKKVEEENNDLKKENERLANCIARFNLPKPDNLNYIRLLISYSQLTRENKFLINTIQDLELELSIVRKHLSKYLD
jgi:hypothetical protein